MKNIGNRRSGRTTKLINEAIGFLDIGVPVVIVTANKSHADEIYNLILKKRPSILPNIGLFNILTITDPSKFDRESLQVLGFYNKKGKILIDHFAIECRVNEIRIQMERLANEEERLHAYANRNGISLHFDH